MSTAGTSLFGISYSIKIDTPDGSILVASDQFDVALRCVFEVQQTLLPALWFCTLSIYNLAPKTRERIMQGSRVVIEAGFKDGVHGVIWDGPVFQPQWERENVTDFKTTLHCIMGVNELVRQVAIGSVNAFTAQDDIVRQIAARCENPIPVAYLAPKTDSNGKPNWKQATSVLPEPIFGNPRNLLDNIAENNNMQWFYGYDGIHMGNFLTMASTADVITYTPSTGLLGTPQQVKGPTISSPNGSTIATQGGITFRVPLDARMKVTMPPLSVRVDNASIRTMLRNIGEFPTILEKDGIYKVAGVRHVGDSRGNDWFTEITGYTTSSPDGIATMLSDSTMDANASQ
jgi:hypothetical protein